MGGYDILKAKGALPDPEWPDLSFEEIVKIAFRDNFVNDLNHPALKRLRGE